MEAEALFLTTKRIGIVIQCRDGSTRYKEKSIRPFFDGKSILEIIVDRFRIYDYPIIVATSKNSLKTIALCHMMDVLYYIGSEDDVLTRIYETLDIYNLDGILRVCADNPFVDLGLMYPVITWAETMDYDYVAFDNCMRRHEGFFLEYISAYALGVSVTDSDMHTDHEHVTPYIIRHPELFKQKILPIPPIMNEVFVRLTVDTEDDFKTAQEIYKHVGGKHWSQVYIYLGENEIIELEMLKGMVLNPKQWK